MRSGPVCTLLITHKGRGRRTPSNGGGAQLYYGNTYIHHTNVVSPRAAENRRTRHTYISVTWRIVWRMAKFSVPTNKTTMFSCKPQIWLRELTWHASYKHTNRKKLDFKKHQHFLKLKYIYYVISRECHAIKHKSSQHHTMKKMSLTELRAKCVPKAKFEESTRQPRGLITIRRKQSKCWKYDNMGDTKGRNP
jgi:hypothetical protein